MEPTEAPPKRAPGEILRDIRKLLAPEGTKTLTQAKLAEQLGYNDEYLQSMESGRRPMQPHVVDGVARLRDEARYPDAFERLVEELRTAVTAHWAGMAQPTDSNPDDEGAALDKSLTGKLEGKLDGLRVTVDVLAAKTEGRLDGLGGKLDRAEGTLAVLGNKLDTTSAKSEAALGTLGGKVDGASARTEEALGALGREMEAASARTDGQLSEVAANVADAGHKLDRTDAKVESVRTQAAQTEKKVTRKLDMVIRALWANFGLGLVCAASFILHCHRAPSAVQLAQGGAASIGVGQGAAEIARGVPKDRCIDNPSPPCLRVLGDDVSGHLGKTAPAEKWFPAAPLEGQRLPPCDEGLGQEAISGGCWLRVDAVRPPCGRLYRKGDSCWVPIAADPKQPVGGAPQQVTPERQNQSW